jgi:hypothetical protein
MEIPRGVFAASGGGGTFQVKDALKDPSEAIFFYSGSPDFAM